MISDSAHEASLHACLTKNAHAQGEILQMLSTLTVHLKLDNFHPSRWRNADCPVRRDAKECPNAQT